MLDGRYLCGVEGWGIPCRNVAVGTVTGRDQYVTSVYHGMVVGFFDSIKVLGERDGLVSVN